MPTKGDVEYYEGKIVEFTVAVDQTIEKGDIVAITGDWEVSRVNAVTDKAIGVALNAGVSTALVTQKIEVLTMAPIVYVVNTGGVSAGDFLTPSTAGTVATFSDTLATPQVLVGMAMEDALTTELVAMMLMHGICTGKGT